MEERPAVVDDGNRPIVSDGEEENEPENENVEENHSILCDPFRNVHRFVVLIFMCLLNFGNYFCYDNPAALEDSILENLELTTSKYGILYFIVSWPNVILAFFGGYLMDRVFGLRLGAVIFASFIAVGQIVFSIGALSKSFGIMVFGRLIFAIGGESLAVAQNTYAVKWFKGKELMTVFGIQLSFARIGSTVNMYVMKPLFNSLSKTTSGPTALGLTLLLGGGTTTIISWLCAIILLLFDRRYDRLMEKAAKESENAENQSTSSSNADVIKFRDVLHFPLSMWMLCVVCVTYYVAIFPFVGFGLMFFTSKYEMDTYTADVCNSLIYLISIGASPLSGFLVDLTGRNIFWVIVSVIFTIVGHGLMAFSFVTPYLPMVIIGVAYSLLASSLWPCVAYVVPAKNLNTAYGVMQSIQNLGLTCLYISVGAVVDARGYLVLELYFLTWLSVALCASIALWFIDSSRKGLLNLSRADRSARLEAIEKKGA